MAALARLIGSAALVSTISSGCAGAPAGQPPTGPPQTEALTADLAIVDVSVIPMTHDTVLEGRTVLVRGGTIVSISPTGSSAPDADRIVNGRGRYLIPGLTDMHTHVYGETELALYVANGVTRIRNMWGSHTALAMRARADSGVIVSPRIVTAGRLVDGEPPAWGAASAVVTDPATARAIMDEEKAAGFDFLKVYVSLSAETFDAIMAHSREIGHPVAGHVPRDVPLDDALRSGMASIEHLTGWGRATEVYRPDGPDEAAAILRRIEAGEAEWDVLYDPERARSLAALAARTGAWQVPTLVWSHRVYTSRRQARDQFARPEMRYVSPRRRATWDPATSPWIRHLPDETLEAFQVIGQSYEVWVGALHEAGARILAGTDPPNPFVIPGFAIHDELGYLVDAGLTPYEALVAATRGPAEFLGNPEGGTVRPGNDADLVLLGSNPLLDVSATRDVAGVVLRGRWLPRDELDAMLEATADRYRPPDDWFAGLPPLPADGQVRTYWTQDRGVTSRAERVTGAAGAGLEHVTVAQRATSSATGDRVSETLRITTGPDGEPAELLYTQSVAGGAATVRVRAADGRLRVTGQTVDGQPIERRVSLELGERVSCDMTACVERLLPGADELAVGQRREVGIRTLEATVGSLGEASGNPVFVAETWEWMRIPDDGAVRVYEVTVRRTGGEWTLHLTADADGLLELEREEFRPSVTRRGERRPPSAPHDR